jgi:DeoR/GlpR family transcriptional regulator of sugar metabolism
MLAFERKSRILQYLEQNGKAKVTELAQVLSVTPETIRRDLRQLENQGVLTRTHGGALMKKQKEADYPYQVRIMKNSAEKEKICRHAATFMEDGDMIFVDSSSTLISLIEHINPKIQITILTNSIQILQEFADNYKENVTMICTGGVFSKNNMSLSGTVSNDYSFNFFPNKAFVSCHGVSIDYGFTDINVFELGFRREIINLSGKVFFLADHAKFGRRGPVHLGDLKICDVLITDQAPPDDFISQLTQSNPDLELIIAE